MMQDKPHTNETMTQMNGVSLVRRDGQPKTRYADAERLQILEATEQDLEATIDLFCPGRPLYAITRAHTSDPRDWTTARGRLRNREVLRHLDPRPDIPGSSPRWVAPIAWEYTHWVGIDVDFRGNQSDFRRRCRTSLSGPQHLGRILDLPGIPQVPPGGSRCQQRWAGCQSVTPVESCTAGSVSGAAGSGDGMGGTGSGVGAGLASTAVSRSK